MTLTENFKYALFFFWFLILSDMLTVSDKTTRFNFRKSIPNGLYFLFYSSFMNHYANKKQNDWQHMCQLFTLVCCSISDLLRRLFFFFVQIIVFSSCTVCLKLTNLYGFLHRIIMKYYLIRCGKKCTHITIVATSL